MDRAILPPSRATTPCASMRGPARLRCCRCSAAKSPLTAGSPSTPWRSLRRTLRACGARGPGKLRCRGASSRTAKMRAGNSLPGIAICRLKFCKAFSGVTALLFDIDDTLSTAGKLTAQAYGALERLQRAGKIMVPVTGRPAGWCDHIARMWPVDAVVGENGAFYFFCAGGRLQKRFHDDAATRRAKRARLEAIARRILAAVPGCALAADQDYRETDLAIDYGEDVAPLPIEAAE